MTKPVVPNLTPIQAKIVKAKVQATLNDIPQRVFAPALYPNADPKSAEVIVSRELNKVNVQEALQIALAKHDLTADRITKVVDEAMGASKTVILGNGEEAFADVVPDHSIRLKAAGMAAQWMNINKQDPTTSNYIQVVNNMGDRYDDV